MASAHPLHIENLIANLEEVRRLVEIHGELTGAGPGRRHNVEVLNKSGVVLTVACWEAFIEDLAVHSFDWLLDRATTPAVFPRRVLTLASKELRESHDARRVWELADTGWRTCLKKHRDEILHRSAGRLNTPRPKQVDELFGDLVDLAGVSTSWKWHSISNSTVKQTLDNLVSLRGEIAHRVKSSKKVWKGHVISAVELIRRLSVRSSNTLRTLLMSRVPDSEP